jgi:hypothetical protein
LWRFVCKWYKSGLLVKLFASSGRADGGPSSLRYEHP